MALFRAKEESFDGAMNGGQSFFAFRKRKTNGVIGAGRDDVEFRIEHIDAMHDSVEPGKREGGVALVLPHRVLAEIKNNYQSEKYIIILIKYLPAPKVERRIRVRADLYNAYVFQFTRFRADL